MPDKSHRKSLFVFRRDLRLEDNRGLLHALDSSESVVPLFILDPRQIDPSANAYFSANACRFMFESLVDLDQKLKHRGSCLHLAHGEAEQVLERLLSAGRFDALFHNRDYTPFAARRDQALEKLAKQYGVSRVTCDDALITRPEDVHTDEGHPYKVFSAFFRKARRHADLAEPQRNAFSNYTKEESEGLHGIGLLDELRPASSTRTLAQQGGRDAALARLRDFDFSGYGSRRDRPDIDGTSRLSAHLKFGTVSVREVHQRVAEEVDEGNDNKYLTELYWRDFYAHLLFAYPELLGTAMQEKYRTKTGGSRLEWSRSKQDFERWCRGETGFPIVDAGMRQLNKTGWMHNRVRMIVGSFLTKDLHINWRWGEKYFARHLVDYDPASNNGGWQWVASTGADAQPYFRIFNPWSQQQKFDPACAYIRRYLPELDKLSTEHIHGIEKRGVPDGVDYPAPMVDHREQRQIALQRYQQIG